jgi:hypothetical protein
VQGGLVILSCYRSVYHILDEMLAVSMENRMTPTGLVHGRRLLETRMHLTHRQ